MSRDSAVSTPELRRTDSRAPNVCAASVRNSSSPPSPSSAWITGGAASGGQNARCSIASFCPGPRIEPGCLLRSSRHRRQTLAAANLKNSHDRQISRFRPVPRLRFRRPFQPAPNRSPAPPKQLTAPTPRTAPPARTAMSPQPAMIPHISGIKSADQFRQPGRSRGHSAFRPPIEN